MTATYCGMIGLITINPSSGCNNNYVQRKNNELLSTLKLKC